MRHQDDFDIIKLELAKYTIANHIEFMKLFPCERKNYFIPTNSGIRPIGGYQNLILYSEDLSNAAWSTTGFTKYPMKGFHFGSSRDLIYVICASAKDFWIRWNRYKQLKAFL